MIVNDRYLVALVYTHAQGQQAFWRAQQDGIDDGGIYDAHGTAITIWSDPWSSWAQQAVSVPVGTISVAWNTPDAAHCTVHELEVELGWTREAVERHVRRLFGAVARQEPGDAGQAATRGRR
jgi:hypothetical protein